MLSAAEASRVPPLTLSIGLVKAREMLRLRGRQMSMTGNKIKVAGIQLLTIRHRYGQSREQSRRLAVMRRLLVGIDVLYQRGLVE